MGATWSFTKTFVSGAVLLASELNTLQSDVTSNFTPTGMDDESSNAAAMKAVADPGEVGTESLATDLTGEIQRLRNVIKEVTGEAQWYPTPSHTLITLRQSTIRDRSRFLVIGAITDNTVDIDAKELLLQDTSGNVKRVTAVNLTVDTDTDWTANGSVADGLGRDDDGTLDADTWYYIWVVNGSSGTAAVVTKQATLTNCLANAVSTGGEYDTYGALVGMIRSDATNDLIVHVQRGNKVMYPTRTLVQNAGSSASFVRNDAWTTDPSTLYPPNSSSVLLSEFVDGNTGATWSGGLFYSIDGTNTCTLGPYAQNNSAVPYQNFNQGNTEIIFLDSNKYIYYRVTSTNADADIYIVGYTFEAED